MLSSQLFIASWLALLSDSPLNSIQRKPYEAFVTFLDHLKTIGLRNTVIEFTGLAHVFMSQHTNTGVSASIGEFLPEFKNTPVFFEYNRYHKTGDVSIVSYIYNFLVFGKKLSWVDTSFNEVAFRNWSDIEIRLANQSFDEYDISSLRCIITTLLPVFQIKDFDPKFGPGSVQERKVRGRIEKIEAFQYDYMIDRFYFKSIVDTLGLKERHGLSASVIVPNYDRWLTDRRVSSRIARLIFRDKDLKTSRSICMEPNVIQYFQQGIERIMLELIDKSPFSKFINLEDQGRNRELAQYGSFSTCIDTIDLSSASDCLSYDLFKLVFPPTWQYHMRVVRSHSCYLPDGTIHRLKKFAPMGSALCFPTQCILFTAVVLYSACLHTYNSLPYTGTFLEYLSSNILNVCENFRKYPGYSKTQFEPCAVYGDDICVDTRLTQDIVLILSRLGFVVNTTKSFVGGQGFRESCGGYYLNGTDVTPIYFRVKGIRKSLSGEHLASAVTLANRAWDKGYRKLYSFIVRSTLGFNTRFRHNDKNSIAFKLPSSDTFGFNTNFPTNSHLETRERKRYCRTEYKCAGLIYEYETEPVRNYGLESYEYLRWMGNRILDPSTESEDSVLRYDTGGARIRWIWTPLY